MSEPRGPEMTPDNNEGLTTEQLANAGAPTTAEEPRTFAEPGMTGRDATEHDAIGHDATGREQAADQPIFPEHEAADFRQSWTSIQASFVDEPRRAVEEADHLVAATMKRLAEMFAEERSRLEAQWGRGDDVSTEDLRVALQRYRAFFGRLLAV